MNYLYKSKKLKAIVSGYVIYTACAAMLYMTNTNG
jgi:hypothetical protein